MPARYRSSSWKASGKKKVRTVALRATTGRDVRLIMVGGKGGVGKTTCASAIAMGLASGGRRVLLILIVAVPSFQFACPVLAAGATTGSGDGVTEA